MCFCTKTLAQKYQLGQSDSDSYDLEDLLGDDLTII